MVLTQVVVAVLTASVVYVGWRHLEGNLSAGSRIDHQHAKTIPEQDRDADHEPLNILVLGTDSRAGAGDAIDGETGCNCSDTSILVHLSADRRSAYGVSIPRDALVAPVACTRDVEYQDTGLVEWNAAFSAGGAACAAEQLEKDFHVFVDDYVVMDFSGFRNMVSAIGGVNVCIPFVLSDPTHAKVTFAARKVGPPRRRGRVVLRPAPVRARRDGHRPDQAPAGVRQGAGRQAGVDRHPDPAGSGSTGSPTH